MKLINIYLATTIIGVADAMSLRGVFHREHSEEVVASDTVTPAVKDEISARNLQAVDLGNCPAGTAAPAAAWHPVYAAGWTNGHCRYAIDCNSPSYTSELSCCNGAYPGQVSGACLQSLPNPPTPSPTQEPEEVWYPDYATAWSDAGCINTLPVPSGRPEFSSQLECCQKSYSGQVSGKCISMLPNAPTSSPTTFERTADFWYPDYESAWNVAGCLNTLPLPFANKSDRPSYSTQLECCQKAYGGQSSGACVSMLAVPPTASPTTYPTEPGTLEQGYYADYTANPDWSIATCTNVSPKPNNGSPVYETKEKCCQGQYGGQMSHACMCWANPCYSCQCTGAGSWHDGGGACPNLIFPSGDYAGQYTCAVNV